MLTGAHSLPGKQFLTENVNAPANIDVALGALRALAILPGRATRR